MTSKSPDQIGHYRVRCLAGEGQFAKVIMQILRLVIPPVGRAPVLRVERMLRVRSSWLSMRGSPMALEVPEERKPSGCLLISKAAPNHASLDVLFGMMIDLVAIKQLKQLEDLYVEREIEILRKLKHPNVILLFEVFRHKGRLHMVFEYADMDMIKLLSRNRNGLCMDLVKRYTRQLLCALSHCHTQAVLHRDVKPENLLIALPSSESDKSCNDTKILMKSTLKLCDFGCARVAKKVDGALSGYVATRWYRPPELLQGHRTNKDISSDGKKGTSKKQQQESSDIPNHPEVMYGAEVDIWATGCVVAEMITGCPLFMGDSDIDQLDKIMQGLTPPQDSSQSKVHKLLAPKIGPKGLNFIERLLALDPAKRPTAGSSLCNPFLHDLELRVLTGTLGKRASPAHYHREDDIAEEVDYSDTASAAIPLSTPHFCASPGSVASTGVEYGSEFFAADFSMNDSVVFDKEKKQGDSKQLHLPEEEIIDEVEGLSMQEVMEETMVDDSSIR
eukprot:jgi/Bigna1/87591/estExt_fgenesh1_pg.C_220047